MRTIHRGEFMDLDPAEERIIGQRRWVTEFERVVELEGRYWRGVIDMPSTEIQDDSDFEEWVQLEPVKQVERVTKVWVRDDQAGEQIDAEVDHG